MRRRVTGLIAIALLACAFPAAAAEQTVESKVESVGMFKNGLAYVTRTVTLPDEGEYVLYDVPQASHGTFWIESPTSHEVDVLMTKRDGDKNGDALFMEKLIGAKIDVHFRHEGLDSLNGTVTGTDASDEVASEEFSRNYEANRYGWYPSAISRYGQPAPNPGASVAPKRIVISTEQGDAHVDPSLVEYAVMEMEDGSKAVLSGDSLRAALTKKKPATREAMVLRVTELPTPKQHDSPLSLDIRISYLTKGIAWAPSYRIDISDPEELRITQKAIIKNELESLEDAEFYLITGFPSVEFGNVTSPMSMKTTWSTFFQELSNAANGVNNRSHVMTQQMVMSNYAAPSQSVDFSANISGEGPDLHYQPIGKHTLALGDSLTLTLGTEAAEYERIIEWIVPDSRAANGRYSSSYDQEDPEKWNGVAWDSLQFKNPFDYPMTTGPAMVTADGQLLGQRTSYFVNSGEQTTVQITKALSIRTHAFEQEMPDTRETVRLGGYPYYKRRVSGSLQINNHRAESVRIIIRRRFSGEAVGASDDAQSRLLAAGVWSANPRNEIVWELTLEPGEDKELKYQYDVLVRH